MNFFNRLSNGWKITMNSFSILKKNKQLIIFPVLSGISLVVIMGSFIVGLVATSGWDVHNIVSDNKLVNYLVLFGFYFINYFIIVFFNMALIHCTRLYFNGEEVSVSVGLRFSMSRVGVILSWAFFAATVGTILKAIQENTGFIGKIISGFFGIVWGITTFFVVPIIAYENLGPIDAFKRSAQLMKEKWGESLGATFSLHIITFLGFLIIALPAFLLGSMVDPILGITLAILAGFVIFAIMSAAETIFISSVYHNVTGDLDAHFDSQLVDNLFVKKK
jgi:hypothetical protein